MLTGLLLGLAVGCVLGLLVGLLVRSGQSTRSRAARARLEAELARPAGPPTTGRPPSTRCAAR